MSWCSYFISTANVADAFGTLPKNRLAHWKLISDFYREICKTTSIINRLLLFVDYFSLGSSSEGHKSLL